MKNTYIYAVNSGGVYNVSVVDDESLTAITYTIRCDDLFCYSDEPIDPKYYDDVANEVKVSLGKTLIAEKKNNEDENSKWRIFELSRTVSIKYTARTVKLGFEGGVSLIIPRWKMTEKLRSYIKEKKYIRGEKYNVLAVRDKTLESIYWYVSDVRDVSLYQLFKYVKQVLAADYENCFYRSDRTLKTYYGLLYCGDVSFIFYTRSDYSVVVYVLKPFIKQHGVIYGMVITDKIVVKYSSISDVLKTVREAVHEATSRNDNLYREYLEHFRKADNTLSNLLEKQLRDEDAVRRRINGSIYRSLIDTLYLTDYFMGVVKNED